MSNKQSGMMVFAEEYAKAKLKSAQLLIVQYMVDTLQITIHQTEGWGYDRIKRLSDAWKAVRDEYSPLMEPSHPDADVMQEHMDRVMLEIIGKKQDLIPFEERYPELKRSRTGKI